MFSEKEKQILFMFGCSNYRNTMERLAMVCAMTIDPLYKASANSLRNKLADCPCDSWYKVFYLRVRIEMSDLHDADNAA